uniref:Uncharacterized LOC115410785 n=1 Tax=Sphaeramia orbicularis TaxID=375764 RepID=A0A673AIH5_9TELE
METLSTYLVEETSHVRSEEEEEEEEEEEDDSDEEKDDSCIDESAVQKQQRPAWAPHFFFILDKEVYNYVGQQIVIEEAVDSYGGMIWPAALALSQYLESHSEQLSLVDKTVLELGAGVGLVSIVAALLGAWVTATDLSDVLSNLRVNLSRNTRGRCRHTPQVAVLSWGYNLKDTYPTSVYHYDYVLASDVVYHHDFLDELLATMKHFCQPGTTLIWANKVRMECDMRFTKNFLKAFHTSLLFDDGDMKIYMATCKEEEAVGDMGLDIQDPLRKEEDENDKEKLEEEKQREVERKEENDGDGDGAGDGDEDDKEYCRDKPITNKDVAEEAHLENSEEQEDSEEDETGDEDDKDDEMDKPDSVTDGNVNRQVQIQQTAAQPNKVSNWKPGTISGFDKDIYHYVGQDIVIRESIDSFGAVMWPAALALCSFLDNNTQNVNLKDKKVLELGAGTGLVSIVASLLGASVTSTDLPDVLGNLRFNVIKNTSGHCRHTPQVEVLSWGHDIKHTHPTSVYRYDYVLAADVVYHHDFLDELLVTMKHFCQPGTTLIWANKIRMVNDVTFVEDFKKAFHTRLLVSDGDMKIFMGTCKE